MDMLAARNDSDDEENDETMDAQSVASAKKMKIEPLYILNNAFTKARAPGSSTVLLAIANKDVLNVVNLGDSGFVHYRQ